MFALVRPTGTAACSLGVYVGACVARLAAYKHCGTSPLLCSRFTLAFCFLLRNFLGCRSRRGFSQRCLLCSSSIAYHATCPLYLGAVCLWRRRSMLRASDGLIFRCPASLTHSPCSALTALGWLLVSAYFPLAACSATRLVACSRRLVGWLHGSIDILSSLDGIASS